MLKINFLENSQDSKVDLNKAKPKFNNAKSLPARQAVMSVLLFALVLGASFAGYKAENAMAAAGIPAIINYQGRLTNASGTVITAATDMRFVIYDSLAAGSCVWSATGSGLNGCGNTNAGQLIVTPSNGVFSVPLGDTSFSGGQNALPVDLFSDDSRYLEVRLYNGSSWETLTPRKRILGSPYAFNSNLLDQLATSSVGGVSAYVPVTDASGNLVLSQDLTVDTNTLFVDSTNNRIGIGTAAPDGVMHLVADTSSAIGQIVLQSSTLETATSGYQLNFRNSLGSDKVRIEGVNSGDGDAYLALSTWRPAGGLTEALRINNAQQVGIGTATPGYTLDVVGDINLSGTLSVGGVPFSGGSSQWITTGSDIYYDTGNVGIGTTTPTGLLHVSGTGNVLPIIETVDSNSSGIIYKRFGGNDYFTGTSFSAGNVYDVAYDMTSSASRIAVTSAGFVGIGTADPGFKLDVFGQVSINNDATSAPVSRSSGFVDGDKLVLFSDGNNKRVIGTNNGGYGFYFQNDTSDNDGYTFIEGDDAVNVSMRIKNGQVGVGTDNPGALLSLGGSIANTKLALYDSGGELYGLGIGGGELRFHLNDNTSRFAFYDAPAGNELVRIQGNGYVGIGTTIPAGILDVRGGTAADGLAGTDINLYAQAGGSGDTNGGNIILMPGEYGSPDGFRGKVGIWTDTPTSTLTVNGGTVLFGSTNTGGSVLSNGYESLALAYADDSGSVQSSGWGSIAAGYASNTGSNLLATANGSASIGRAASGGTLQATAIGAFAHGSVTDASSEITASGVGSTAIGNAQGGGSTFIKASDSGAIAGGHAENATIFASYKGAIALGYSANGSALESTGGGSLSFGLSYGTGTLIRASGNGAAAFGYGDDGGSILSGGSGSLAFGDVSGAGASVIQASANGAFAGGSVEVASGSILASGKGSFAFGVNNVQSTAIGATTFGINGANSGINSFLIALKGASANTLTAANTFAVMGDGNSLFTVDSTGGVATSGNLTFGTTSATIDFNSTQGELLTWKVPQNATNDCVAGAVTEGIIIADNGGTQRGHICVSGTDSQLHFFAEAFTGSGTDVAENYATNPSDGIMAGDLVAIDQASGNLYVDKAVSGGSRAIGVISTAPGIMLSGISESTGISEASHPRPVALAGRVPTTVSNANGAIEVGDPIAASSVPGVGVKATATGQIVGFALEAFNSAIPGKIKVFIQPGYNDGTIGLATGAVNPASGVASGELAALTVTSDLNMSGFAITNVYRILGVNGQWLIDENGVLATVTKTDGAERTLYASSSQNVTVTLYGSGKLASGHARVDFTQEQKDVISPNVPYNVTITLTDSGKGAYVANKNSDGFDVNELDGGRSGATFDWTVIARRKGYEGAENFGVTPDQVAPVAPAPEEPTPAEGPTINDQIPNTEPAVEPVPEPEPEPVVEPSPEPVVEPTSDPVPEPISDPVPDPVASQ